MRHAQQTVADRATKQAAVMEVLPEIGLLGDARYRSAVLEIWTEMWARSPHPDISTAPFSHKCPGVTLVEHVRAVTLAAHALARIITDMHGIQVDQDLLLAACLLHDVSKLVEIGPDGRLTREGRLFPHAYLAAEAASRADLPDELASLIVTHTPVVTMMSPCYVEARILEHADLVSAYVLIDSNARAAERDDTRHGGR